MHFFIILISLVFLSCSQPKNITGGDETLDSIPNVPVYNSTNLYNHGQFVSYNSKIYRASTTVRGLTPSSYTAGVNKPMNPWVVSTHKNYSFNLKAKNYSIEILKYTNIAYYYNDVVVAGNKYYKAIWYTTKSPIIKANIYDDANTSGSWLSITKKEALKAYSNAILSISRNIVDKDLAAVSYKQEQVIMPFEGTVSVSDTEFLKKQYVFDIRASYLKNEVVFYNEKYFRAKWWTMGTTPYILVDSLKTPWQEVSETRFRQLVHTSIPTYSKPGMDKYAPAGDPVVDINKPVDGETETGKLEREARIQELLNRLEESEKARLDKEKENKDLLETLTDLEKKLLALEQENKLLQEAIKEELRLKKEREEEEKKKLAQEDAERLAQEEAERLAKEKMEREAKAEAERLAKAEAERLAREAAEALNKDPVLNYNAKFYQTNGPTTSGPANLGVGAWSGGAPNIISQGYHERWWYNSKSLPTHIKNAIDGADIFYNLNGEKAVNLFRSKLSESQWNAIFPQGPEGTMNIAVANGYFEYSTFIEALEIFGKYAFIVESTSPNFTGGYKWYTIYKARGTNSADIRLIANTIGAEQGSYIRVIDFANFGTEGTENDILRSFAALLAHMSHETGGGWTFAFDRGLTASFDKTLFPGKNFNSETVSGGRLSNFLTYALWFMEEKGHNNKSDDTVDKYYYQSYHSDFPALKDKSKNDNGAISYHGRGGLQTSWNYNYGMASGIFFGDNRILLQNPYLILDGVDASRIGSNNFSPLGTKKVAGGVMGFLTSFVFYMSPQSPKPSMQDAMILNTHDGSYVQNTTTMIAPPTVSYAKLPEQIYGVSNPSNRYGFNGSQFRAGFRGQPGFGWTANIINGGFEAHRKIDPNAYSGGEDDNYKVYWDKLHRRVILYRAISEALGAKIHSTEKLDTWGYVNYAQE